MAKGKSKKPTGTGQKHPPPKRHRTRENIPETRHRGAFFGLHPAPVICAFLVVATLAVYWQVTCHEFVNFDDGLYVTENRHVQSKQTLESILWAFSFSDKKNIYWHPLTWLSHILDYRLFGLNPGMHHLVNLFFHATNCLLLFLVFRQMTGELWKSAFVAALFALHPLNVDSVAWVAERKNLLSTFFWMLTLLSYAWYTRRPGFNRYILTCFAFVCGLLTKPMLITLPFVLLLLDYWPLKRMRLPVGPSMFRLVIEKIPLFCFSAFSIYLSISLLADVDNIIAQDLAPMKLRIENALVSYVGYMGKTIWPQDLAVLYPYPLSIPFWKVICSGLFLAVMALAMTLGRKKRPYLFVGWFWFLGTLVPVIGLVQNGLWPALADRWAYVPIIGLFVIAAWGIPDLLARWRYKNSALGILGGILLVTFAVITLFQIGYWKNSRTLFEHTIEVTGDNPVAHNNLGVSLKEMGEIDAAIQHYREALRIKPDYSKARNNLGAALETMGEIDAAIAHYREVLRIKPDHASTCSNLGGALKKQGHLDEAVALFQKALRLQPDHSEAHNNLGVTLEEQGRIDEAIAHFREALRIKPDYADAHSNLGSALLKQGRTEEAIIHCQKALRIQPDLYLAHNYLGVALVHKGNIKKAIQHFQEALRIKPDYYQAHNNLGIALAQKGDTDEAKKHFQKALRIKPDNPNAKYNLKRLSGSSK